MKEIDYFYSAHSAFAYLGSARFMSIAKAAGRRIVHKPMDLAKTMSAAGALRFNQRPDAHINYYFGREIDRWSEYRDAPVLGYIPTHHANDTSLANGVLIAGALQGRNVDALAHALLEAHWRDDADLADTAALARIADAAGYDAAALLYAARSPDVVAVYARNTEEAIERSVFGSPSYFVDGDMFYGQDRLEFVERALVKPFRSCR